MICNTTVCTDSEGWSHIIGMTYKQILLMWELENWLVPRYSGPEGESFDGQNGFPSFVKSCKSFPANAATSLSDWIG